MRHSINERYLTDPDGKYISIEKRNTLIIGKGKNDSIFPLTQTFFHRSKKTPFESIEWHNNEFNVSNSNGLYRVCDLLLKRKKDRYSSI